MLLPVRFTPSEPFSLCPNWLGGQMAPTRTTQPPSHLVHTLKSHKGPVNCCVYNSGANYFLTGGQDRAIKLWNPRSGLEIKSYNGHTYEVLGLCW